MNFVFWLQSMPCDVPSKWECNKCGYEIPDEIGKSVLFKAYKESEELISIKSNRTVEKYERYIEKYQKTLHPGTTHKLHLVLRKGETLI